MSVSPPTVPLPSPTSLTNPVEAAFERALGAPANQGGLRAQHLAQLLQTALPTLQSITFTVSAISDAPFPAQSTPITETTQSLSLSRIDSWTENGVSYSADETDDPATSQLSYGATINDPAPGDWTYNESVTLNYTITTYVVNNNTQIFNSYAAGQYAYTFTASGNASSSNYTFTVTTGTVTAYGTVPGPLYMANAAATTDGWTETISSSRTITDQYSFPAGGTGPTSASGSDSGGSSMTASYWTGDYLSTGSSAASGPYTDPDNSAVTGTAGESGSRSSSSNYNLAYSASGYDTAGTFTTNGVSVTSGSANASQGQSDNAGYSARAGYTPSGPFSGSGATATGAGTVTLNGGHGQGANFSGSYAPAYGGEYWSQSSGSGTAYQSGWNDSSYSDSGNYSVSGSGGTINGAFSDSGNDNSSYNCGTGWGWQDGGWCPQNSSGSGSDSGSDHASFSGAGSYGASGDGWSASGSLTQSGGGSDSYGYNTRYNLDGYNNWVLGSGSGGSSGSGFDNLSYSGSGTYTSSGSGALVNGTFQQSGSDNTSYNFNSAASGSGGTWYQSGSATAVESGSDHSPYSGAGTCPQGALSVSGRDDDSYNDTTHYSLNASGNWVLGSGSGGWSASGYQDYSYSGASSYSMSFGSGGSMPMSGNVGQVSGTTEQGGSGSFNYQDNGSSTLNNGQWQTASASGSTWGSDSGWSSFSGSGSYSRTDSSTYALSGTVQVNGYESGSDSYQTALGLVDGNLVNISGSGTSSKSGSTCCSYSGGGMFSTSSSATSGDGSYQSSWLNSTASEHGYQDNSQSQSQGWTINNGQWAASGSGQATSNSSGELYFNFSASGGSTYIDPVGDTTTINYNEQVISDTFWQNGATSGSGSATYYQTENYCPAGGGDPTTALSTSDTWDKSSYGGQNQTSGETSSGYNPGNTVPGVSQTASYNNSLSAGGPDPQEFYHSSASGGGSGLNLTGIGTPPLGAAVGVAGALGPQGAGGAVGQAAPPAPAPPKKGTAVGNFLMRSGETTMCAGGTLMLGGVEMGACGVETLVIPVAGEVYEVTAVGVTAVGGITAATGAAIDGVGWLVNWIWG